MLFQKLLIGGDNTYIIEKHSDIGQHFAIARVNSWKLTCQRHLTDGNNMAKNQSKI